MVTRRLYKLHPDFQTQDGLEAYKVFGGNLPTTGDVQYTLRLVADNYIDADSDNED